MDTLNGHHVYSGSRSRRAVHYECQRQKSSVLKFDFINSSLPLAKIFNVP